MNNIYEQLLLKHVLTPGLPFLVTYTCATNFYLGFSFYIIIYSFVYQFYLHPYWYCCNQKKSSGCVLQKTSSYRFCKNLLAQRISYEFFQLFYNIFFKEPFGRLLLHKHPFCLQSHHDLLSFQKRCHIYFPAEYFLTLISRLRTGVRSMLPRRRFFAKIVNNLKQLKAVKYFRRKCSIIDVWPASNYASLRSH